VAGTTPTAQATTQTQAQQTPQAATAAATGANAPVVPPTLNLTPQTTAGYFGNSGLPQSNVNLDPSSFMSSLNTYLQPMFGQQQQALTSDLADAGIYGGSTAGAEGALASQQQQQEQGIAGQDLLSLLGLGTNQSEFNAGNALQAGEFDISNYNNAKDLGANFENQDYLTNEGYNESLLAGGATSQDPVYQQPGQTNLGSLGTGLGQSVNTSTAPATLEQPYTPAPTPTYDTFDPTDDYTQPDGTDSGEYPGMH
jgi:hypothetical protein